MSSASLPSHLFQQKFQINPLKQKCLIHLINHVIDESLSSQKQLLQGTTTSNTTKTRKQICCFGLLKSFSIINYLYYICHILELLSCQALLIHSKQKLQANPFGCRKKRANFLVLKNKFNHSDGLCDDGEGNVCVEAENI